MICDCEMYIFLDCDHKALWIIIKILGQIYKPIFHLQMIYSHNLLNNKKNIKKNFAHVNNLSSICNMGKYKYFSIINQSMHDNMYFQFQ